MNTACFNYPSVSEDKRIVQAYTDMMAAGVNKYKAQSLIPISMNESTTIWCLPRAAQGLWFPPQGCGNCRQIIGWEYGIKKDANGNNHYVVRHLPTDPTFRSWLQAIGVINADGTPSAKMLNAGREPLAAAWFERAFSMRDVQSLQNFSLGPTQMFLYWSTLFQGKPTGNGYPSTWEDLWSFYTLADAGEVANRLVYMDPGHNPYAKEYPAQDPTNEALGTAWLTNQVGNATGASAYWNGNGFRSYSKNLLHVIALTNSIQPPTAGA
jgi:hypothetical protein